MGVGPAAVEAVDVEDMADEDETGCEKREAGLGTADVCGRRVIFVSVGYHFCVSMQGTIMYT